MPRMGRSILPNDLSAQGYFNQDRLSFSRGQLILNLHRLCDEKMYVICDEKSREELAGGYHGCITRDAERHHPLFIDALSRRFYGLTSTIPD